MTVSETTVPEVADEATEEPGYGEPPGVREVRAALDRETRRRRDAEEALAEARAESAAAGSLRVENLMLRAGVDVDTPIGRTFYGTYDGELTVEAVRAAYGDHLSSADRAAVTFAEALTRQVPPSTKE
jgi:hypothetical protein